MTDLQVKAQSNLIAEEKNAIARREAEIAQQRATEEARANRQTESLKDAENLAKYGYAKYGAQTSSGQWQQDNARGKTYLPFDFFRDAVGSLVDTILPIGKLK